MNATHLLAAGVLHLNNYPDDKPPPGITDLFSAGARWMHDRLGELEGKHPAPFDPTKNYTFYGWLKYGICGTGFLLSLIGLSKYSLLFMPLSLLFFYLLEIHFLFLFPLLIDHSTNPIGMGIKEVYKIGVFKCLITVIPIGVFMMIGLLRKDDRFRNWYIGCLAILIWYNNEARNRI
ncbi:MAG TPA: hypothetical protein VGM30_17235 [Puia sp.]|jgi:hypothetical protein